ncbi:uncharacterized protein CCOS01_06295 [Colletotrichum costaricense]|uniref:Uncharacterized protein n=1 Tax=Colletotrichum costaricense TaxID=1209916 RepID=A0AAJ0E0S6_9PEZI|nr:uncharacterized protein CCOS01_06295 [Colletotrichum costaricense]KAK1528461.1 hypothetical protein CCOS01_06295 [Colletotrichum costaricense]
MRFTVALTTLVAAAMAAPLDTLAARADELNAAIQALAAENPEDAEAAKGLLGRDINPNVQLTNDDEQEEVFKRDINPNVQLTNDDEQEEVFKRDINPNVQLTNDDEQEEVFKRDIDPNVQLTNDDEQEEVF